MAMNQPPAFVSANMNMTVTIFGFVLSALFMLIICCRLLCFRFHSHDEMIGGTRDRTHFVDRALGGLEPSIVASFPTIKYTEQIFVSDEDNLCTICLGEYKAEEALKVLPSCGHAFHVGCIDTWLRQHPTCPVCRVSLQIFPGWRRVSGPLISLSAKPRFVVGAIPDNMFEQPRSSKNSPTTRQPKESIAQHKHQHPSRILTVESTTANTREILPCYSHPDRAMIGGYKAFVEMAESSLSRQQVSIVDTEEASIPSSRPCNKKVMIPFEDSCPEVKAPTEVGEALSIVSKS